MRRSFGVMDWMEGSEGIVVASLRRRSDVAQAGEMTETKQLHPTLPPPSFSLTPFPLVCSLLFRQRHRCPCSSRAMSTAASGSRRGQQTPAQQALSTTSFRKRQQPAAESNPSRGQYGAISQDDPGQSSRTSSKSIYNRKRVKVVFAIGTLLITINLFWLVYLLTLLFHPSLHAPYTAAPLLQADLHLLSLLILLPGLMLLDLPSTATRKVHIISLVGVAALAGTLLLVPELRQNGTTLSSAPALVLFGLSLLWSILTGTVIEGLHADTWVQPSRAAPGEAEPLLRLDVDPSPPTSVRIKRWLRIIFSTIGSTIVLILTLSLVANVVIDAIDGSATTPGQRLWVSPARGNAISSSKGTPLRLHVGLEEAPVPCPEGFSPSLKSDTPSNYTKWGDKPTAIFFPPVGISGYTASHWLRKMISRTRNTDYDQGKKEHQGEDDGHLALRRLVWFDAPGTGYSDYSRGSEGLDVQGRALVEALQQLDLLPADLSSSPENVTTEEQQFILVSLTSGSLLASYFATLLPSSSYIHSQVLLDAETIDTFYSTAVSPSSGLRRGFGASGQETVMGRVWNDLIPAWLQGISPSRGLGSIFTLQDRDVARRSRILGDRHDRTSFDPVVRGVIDKEEETTWSRWNPLIWLQSVPPPASTLLTLLASHLDSSEGDESSNLQLLQGSNAQETWLNLIKMKPTAILSSFWKIGRDPQGWVQVQRDLVSIGLGDLKTRPSFMEATEQRQRPFFVYDDVSIRKASTTKTSKTSSPTSTSTPAPSPAPPRSRLIGWWRLGSRSNWQNGGDDGHPEGPCYDTQGRRMCEEAVRKCLSWREAVDDDDTNVSTSS